MKLYLIRHAKPEPSGGDAPLSSDGVTQAEKLGAMFRRLIPLDNTSCLTSDQQRARQTGNIIFTRLRGVQTRPAHGIREFTRPAPNVEPAQLLTNMRLVASEEQPENMIAVWHYPSIGEALNLLIGNNSLEWPDIHGATAHVTCPLSLGEGTGKLRWFILPELLP
jgi:phosphohistidine phosphatase SixA